MLNKIIKLMHNDRSYAYICPRVSEILTRILTSFGTVFVLVFVVTVLAAVSLYVANRASADVVGEV
jgi:hypothetical protein